MYLIVINIPKKFHSNDLRNFFSEFIEKEAFTCFHFHHRPQYQLVDLIKCSAPAPPDSGAPGSDDRTTDVRRIEDNDTADGTSQIGESSVSKLPDTEAEKQNDGSGTNLNTDSQGTTRLKTSSQGTTGKGRDSQETTSLKTNSQGNTGKESDSQETTSLKTNSQGNTGKESNSEEPTTVEMSSQGNTGKESGSICSEAEVQGDKNARNDSSSSLKEKLKEGKKKKGGRKWRRFPGRTVKGKGGINNSNKGESSKPVFGTGKEEANKGQQSIIEQDDVLFRLMTEEARGRTCCPLDLKDEHETTFLKKYNHKHWVTRKGDILPQRCYLLRVEFWGPSQGKAATGDYKTQQELSAISLELDHPQSPVEFRPSSAMPQGNVGTPIHRFQELKRSCQLPQKLIKKLGLESPRVSKEDATGCQKDTQTQGEGDIVFTAAGHLIPSSADFEEERKRRMIKDDGMLPKGPKMELESAQNGAEVEERERHEPFHEDVTSQDRIKEQCLEEALEVVWEKGGSGLAFYTEAQLWRAQEGDYGEHTPNECDVDMSVYDGEDSGDKDARGGVETRVSDKLSGGSLQQCILKRKEEEDKGSSRKAKKGKGRRKNAPPASAPKPPPAIGSFEAHTKGIGRRILEAQGWKEGQGLGKELAGRPYALECNGQQPNQRVGLGSTNLSLPQSLRRKGEKDKGSSCGANRGRGGKKIASGLPASGPVPPLAIGSFEAHTKGIGRRILEAQGWKEGQGLGAGAAGRPYALECEGQHPHGRKGLGYHGGKLQGGASTTSATTGKPQPPLADHSNHRISTIFYHAENADPSTPTTQNT